jgi:hypothetical protein
MLLGLDVTRSSMSAGRRHRSSFLEQGLQGQKHHSKVQNCPILELFPPEFKHFPWSDPLAMMQFVSVDC